ncbi:MAG TPA: hypothetical protein VFA04_25310 [Bryobacteraceae bacterium]|nr:hypothetical protein [Bryobacteraceae bacterium]
MNLWVFRRGDWESRPMPEGNPPGNLGLARAAQTFAPDAAVKVYTGRAGAEFSYGIALRIGAVPVPREEWICVPDLPSLLGIMQLLGPWLRGEASLEAYLSAMLDERLGPPDDKPAATGSTRGLTAMSQVLFDNSGIEADLDDLLRQLEGRGGAAAACLEGVLRDVGGVRAQITAEGDPNGTRCDAVLALLQSASLLLHSGEEAGAVEEVRKAIAAWKLDGEPLLP